MRPVQGTYPAFYTGYFDRLTGNLPIVERLKQQDEQVLSHLSALTHEQWAYRYAPGKWTVQDLWTHVTDFERIFGYRALVYARHWPEAQLPLDENVLDKHHPQQRAPQHLLAEFGALRRANILLAETLTADDWSRSIPHRFGPDYHITLEGQFLLIAAHVAHHQLILTERYGL